MTLIITVEVVKIIIESFPNEDFTLNVKLTGAAIPDKLYILMGAQRLKLLPTQNENEFYFKRVIKIKY